MSRHKIPKRKMTPKYQILDLMMNGGVTSDDINDLLDEVSKEDLIALCEVEPHENGFEKVVNEMLSGFNFHNSEIISHGLFGPACDITDITVEDLQKMKDTGEIEDFTYKEYDGYKSIDVRYKK